MIAKIFNHLRRKRLAREIGIPFRRRAHLTLPRELFIANQKVAIHAPTDSSVLSNFVMIFLDDTYRLEKLTTKPKTILDIGANLGFFSLAARARFPDAKIHAYEPNAALEPYLRPHSKGAQFDLFMDAVGLNEGRVSLDIRGDCDLTRSMESNDGTVQQIAFRDTIKRLGGRVDLAKIDCEGAEWLFFEDREAWKAIGQLAMEYHLWPNHTHREVGKIVRDLGFTIEKQVEEGDHGLIYAHQ